MTQQPDSSEALRYYWQTRENKEELIVIARAWRRYISIFDEEMKRKANEEKRSA